ncbi:MAG: hypothetical protein JWQ32_1628 [Marmoricola sp.]|nr:hypothetical protein [Marmoricola sp.]
MGAPDFEDYAEQVLLVVEQIPRGRVTTYGLIAEVLQDALGRGGPRTVAGVMARYGASVTWWRVVRADGSLPEALAVEARQEYLGEGTPLRSSGAVDLTTAVWLPPNVSPVIHSLEPGSVDN